MAGVIELDEDPDIQWFEKFPSCRFCPKPSAGILRGRSNQSYGHHCERCAKKRLADAKQARAIIAKAEGRS
jgi:hypothetical protein